MSSIEIISLVVTIVCLLSFCVAFTFLFRHYYRSETDNVLTGREDPALLEDIAISEEKSGDRKKKALTLSFKIAGYVVLALVAAFFVMTLVARFNSGVLFFGDKAPLVIATGSMSEKNDENDYLFDNGLDNQFDAYDIIGIERYDRPEEVQLYDVVAYRSMEGEIIVHRIVEIREGGYVTRGDANATSDTGMTYEGLLSYDDILGRYNGFRIQGVGSLIVFLQSNAGIITIVSILYCFVMFDRFSSKYEQALEQRKEYLLSELPFDAKDEESREKVTVRFQEELTYRDKTYALLPLTGEKGEKEEDGKREGTDDGEREEEKK